MARPAGSTHLLVASADSLFAVPLVGAGPAAAPSPTLVLQDVEGERQSGVAFFDVAANGTLVYAERDPGRGEHDLVWVSRNGEIEPLPTPPREYQMPRISPDGRRIAVGIGPGAGGPSDIWICDWASASQNRFTFDRPSTVPLWTPDGSRIAYGSDAQLMWKRTDGSSSPETLLAFEGTLPRFPLAWSPDGEWLIYLEESPKTRGDLFAYSLKQRRTLPLLVSPALDWGAALSPDGKWMAYTSDESGPPEVYVQAFPPAGGKWEVSNGGTLPIWAPDGGELFYIGEHGMMAVAVRTAPTFSHGAPRELFRLDDQVLPVINMIPNFDISRDGKRFLMVRRHQPLTTNRHVNVILGWEESLRQPPAPGAPRSGGN